MEHTESGPEVVAQYELSIDGSCRLVHGTPIDFMEIGPVDAARHGIEPGTYTPADGLKFLYALLSNRGSYVWGEEA